MSEFIKLSEPTLLFGYDQRLEDPRDGLTLFGPLDEGKPHGVRMGVIGTKEGVAHFKRWVEQIQHFVADYPARTARPPFPGFEQVFGIPWNPKPDLVIEFDRQELNEHLYIGDSHQRVYQTVDFFSERILEAKRTQESRVDLWFVIVPDDVYKYCRPQSKVEKNLKLDAPMTTLLPMNNKRASAIRLNLSMFEDDHQAEQAAAIAYEYDVHFRNQLKARLLKEEILTQVIREGTVTYDEENQRYGTHKRPLTNLQSNIAWNICSGVFYKMGGRPWKLGNIRDGVCYIGLVFKQDEKSKDPRSSCCAAQMFLDSGDGIVFKGAVGPWHTPGRGDYHLSRKAAQELIGVALKEYRKSKGKAPSELFIHGKVNFYEEEWNGFQDAVDSSVTHLVGIRIKDERDFKLYTPGKQPMLRGMALIENERLAYLWTKGYTPRLQTYIGREVPKPLSITVSRGKCDIAIVLRDIMALTKLNYNTCMFADGDPVTLKFADAIGEVLTAGPVEDIPPLPFRYYI